MTPLKKIGVGLVLTLASSAALALAIIARRGEESMRTEALPGDRSASAASQPSASHEGSVPAPPVDPEADKGQKTVLCRSLVQNWIAALESGNSDSAGKFAKAVASHGQAGREAVEWALQNLRLPESIQASLKDGLHAF
jgi:hypothetical protein